MTPDCSDYYAPESKFFEELASDFSVSGKLNPEAFYLILDWKASRARTKQLKRLTDIGGSYRKAVEEIGIGLGKSQAAMDRLCLLMKAWKFNLATASAILSVLYPDEFTVYDVRVCEVLGRFTELKHRRFSEQLWSDYQKFISAVRAKAPHGLSLRECDRWLWGADKRRVMREELGL